MDQLASECSSIERNKLRREQPFSPALTMALHHDKSVSGCSMSYNFHLISVDAALLSLPHPSMHAELKFADKDFPARSSAHHCTARHTFARWIIERTPISGDMQIDRFWPKVNYLDTREDGGYQKMLTFSLGYMRKTNRRAATFIFHRYTHTHTQRHLTI